MGECRVSKKEELLAERQRLTDEHLKQLKELFKKVDEWVKENYKGGLDCKTPYDEEEREIKRVFWAKIKKSTLNLENSTINPVYILYRRFFVFKIKTPSSSTL